MARVLYAADGFGGVAGTSIAGRTMDGAGKVPPLGVWTLSGGSPTVGDVRVDGSGNAYQAFTNEYSRYYVDGLGAAVSTDYDIEMDLVMVGLNTPGGIQPAGYTRIDVRIQPSIYANPVNSPPGHDNLGCYYTSFQTSITPLKGFFQAYGGDQIGSISSAAWLPTLNVPFTIRAEVRASNQRVAVYWNNLFVTTITDPLFTGDVFRGFNSGPPGMMVYADPNGYDWKIAEYRVYLIGRANPVPPPPVVPIPTEETMSPGPIYWASAAIGPSASETWATQYGMDFQVFEHQWRVKPSESAAVADRYGYFIALEPSGFSSNAYKSFFGHKFWNTELGRFVRVKRAVIHGKFLWTTIQQNHLEVFALHSRESKDKATFDSGVQCWLGLRTDGHFEFFRGWDSGTSTNLGVVNRTATGISLGVSPESISADIMTITPAQASSGSGNDFNDQFPAKLRRYVFDVEIHPLNGSLTVWKENDAGDMVLFWCLQGINTQGVDAVDALFFTVGQRGSKALNPGSTTIYFGQIGKPFTGSFGFAFRIQEVVVAGQPLGGCDVATLYATGNGDFNQFAELTPPGVTGIARYKYVIDGLQPFNYGFPGGTSDDETAVVQPEAETAVGQVELFTHETLPDPGKPIVGVCVMPMLATRQGVFSFTAQGRPALRLSGTTYVGVARPLFEFLAPEMAGLGPPIPPLTGSRTQGINPPFVEAWQGISTTSPRYQDWFSLIGGLPWDLTKVNAVQMGAVASAPPVHLSSVSLLVVSADPLPTPTNCCGAADSFTGGNDTNITGRTPDGAGNAALANGLYFPIPPAGSHHTDPAFATFVHIDISSGVAVQVSDDNARIFYVLDLLCCLENDSPVEVQGAFTNLGLANPNPLTLGFAWIGVGVRFKSTEETGYSFRLSDNGTWWLSAALNYDYGTTVGDGRLLAQGTLGALVEGQTYRVRLAPHNHELIASIDGVTVATVMDFQIAEGLPALDMHDASGVGGPSIAVSRFFVDGPGTGTSAGGCGGGGGGGSNPAVIETMKNGLWRDVPAPSDSTDDVQVYINGLSRPVRSGGMTINGQWQAFPSGSTFVLDPDDPNTPDTFNPGCCPIVSPMPDPIPLGAKALALYNYTPALVNINRFLPFNGAITGANSQASLSTLLASIAARDMQLWFVPAFRQQQTTNNSGRGPYDHTATMAKFATFSGFTDANIGRIPFAISYDEPICRLCWANSPPTEAQVKAGCAAITSYLGVPCAVRLSPIKMLEAGWTPGVGNIRIGMAQFGGRAGYDADGFGDDYTGYIAAQISAATTLGLDGILWGLNPFRQLSAGWLAAWTDAYLLDKLLKAAAAGMNYGVYMWAGYPPSARLLQPSTNAVLVTGAALL